MSTVATAAMQIKAVMRVVDRIAYPFT
jgi:hypothetical protein